jgi:hypothetical protein
MRQAEAFLGIVACVTSVACSDERVLTVAAPSQAEPPTHSYARPLVTDSVKADAVRFAVRRELGAPRESMSVSPGAAPSRPACLPDQIEIENFCVDTYEAYVVELDVDGTERPHSPYDVVGGCASARRSRRT